LPVKLLHEQFGHEMMLLCGLATKKTAEFSDLTSSFLQIGGNDTQYDEFKPRTVWSLSNAFTSAFKDLDPIPQFRRQPSWAVFSKPVSSRASDD
jgi:hypothetical protein